MNSAAATLPVPASSVFQIPEKSYAALLPAAPAPRSAEQVERKTRAARRAAIEAVGSRAKVRGKRPMHGGRLRTAHATAGKIRGTAHARRGALKHLVPVKRKNL